MRHDLRTEYGGNISKYQISANVKYHEAVKSALSFSEPAPVPAVGQEVSIMLKVSGIVKEYETENGKKRVLDGLSFEVGEAEILGITGKSGAGKTTLMKILRGVEDFDDGYIEIDGERIGPHAGIDGELKLRHATAIHLQRNFGLWGGPAIENVIRRLNYKIAGTEALPMKEHYTYQPLYDEAMEILKMVKLDHKALHSADQLSGGEKQRLVLARQIAAKPRVLLLDEPVTMTGPDTKQEILDVIKELKEKLHIPILVVSHLPEIHMYLADRVIFIDNGKVAADGKPEEILRLFLKEIEPKVEPAQLTEKTPCIRAEHISKRYSLIRVGEVLNIKDLNFEIDRGEIVTLIGSSGAGKTTIMKIIEGLIPPTEGKVSFLYREKRDGKLTGEEEWIDVSNFTDRRIYLRSAMSIMNQEFSMSVNSTVRDQIRFRLSMKRREAVDRSIEIAEELGLPRQILDIIYRLPDMTTEEKDRVMNEIGLPDEIFAELFPTIPYEDVDQYAVPVFRALDLPLEILDRKPPEISGGEHVRAFIALSLATSPDYLLLDEPFGDLDPVTLRSVTNALKRINKEFGTTIVLVSHHMDFVKEVSHRALLIENGALVMDGSPAETCEALVKKSKAVYLDYDMEKLLDA